LARVCNEIDMKETKVGELILQTIDFAKRHKRTMSCEINFSEKGSASLKINPYLFEQMIINLILNAADATESKGKIEIRLAKQSDQVCIEVHDNGPGISEENRKSLFHPFHSTKPDGTGLGLTTVKSCAELHGGSVQVDSSHLGGALFRIVLPG
jgi:signal transduction histidine kinase